MTGHEVNSRALAALEAGDLESFRQTLADREIALRTASPAEQAAALQDGAMLALRLAEFKRSLAGGYARLAQVRDGLASYSGPSLSRGIDLIA